MLTNNWKNLTQVFFSTLHTSTSNAAYPHIEKTITDINGTTHTVNGTSSNIMYNGLDSLTYSLSLAALGMPKTSVNAANTDTGVVFGDGTTAPSADDYWLSGNKITAIGFSTPARSVTIDDAGTISKILTYTITNSGAEDVTISEIGAVGGANYINGSNSSFYYFLMDHTLLDEPVTIPPGGVGQITYTIPFNININE